jgi:curli biogenesis system outer membrane secretion channel CsgG
MTTTREHFRDNKFKANSLKVEFRLVKTKTQKIKSSYTARKKKGLKYYDSK